MSKPRIVIVGAGPTGLGAAWRLAELGHSEWMLFEAREHAGGLASSVRDPRGFTWDMGCHVFYSHYAYVDALLGRIPGLDWLEHRREAWVWIRGRWAPYPLQNNLWRLPRADAIRCLDGLLEARLESESPQPLHTFEDWLRANFGLGLLEIFMLPYTRKVWAYPPATLDVGWMRERVAPVDLRRVLRNFLLRRDDAGWGPNASFRFPRRGGTGAIWERLCAELPEQRVHLDRRVVSINTFSRTVRIESGGEVPYDYLISSMPLDRLVSMLTDAPELAGYADRFVRSACHIVGLGFGGRIPAEIRTKSWIYFPDPELPFHRATVFSNFSSANVPRPGAQWSLLAEISESPHKPVNSRTIVEDTIAGFQRCGFIGDGTAVVSRWHRRLEHGYPTPGLGRDEVLGPVNDELEARGIFSRGRFGAWKYEVSNQDHSVMQGAEAVERILRGGTEYTFRGDVRDSIEAPTSPSRHDRRSAVHAG